MEIVSAIYNMTKEFPQEETCTLSSQMKRAAISIPSNIAEGFQRKHPKEYIQFLNVASPSSAELEAQIIIARKLNNITGQESETLMYEITSLSKMISVLAKKIHSGNYQPATRDQRPETRNQRLKTNYE